MLRKFIFLLFLLPIMAIRADEIDDAIVDDIEVSDVEDTDYLATYDNDNIFGTLYSDFDELKSSVYEFGDEDRSGNEITELVGKLNESEQIFADKRMLKHDPSIIVESDIVKAWKEIYRSSTGSIVSKVIPNDSVTGSRVIAEACASRSNDYAVLDENIEYYKSRNYNAILVTFDKDSTTYEVVELIKHIKSKNMNVWLAFTGKEELRDSVFMDPLRYTDILKAAAQYVDAYLLCWRRTSVHLWKQDSEFVNYTCKVLIAANKDICIFGELYYGENSDSNEKRETAYLYNDNMSGIVVTNYGSIGRNQRYIINKINEMFNGCFIVGNVIGDVPGYLDENSNGKTYSENMDMKVKIEKKFIKAGCGATVVNQNDGKHVIDNDITKTLYRNLNSK